jgi:hypothetical protein
MAALYDEFGGRSTLFQSDRLARLAPVELPHQLLVMTDQTSREIALLRAAYSAFNARNIDAALCLMTPDVEWPRAFKGGFVQGPEAIRAYWTEQWSEIDPHVEPVAFSSEESGSIQVEVHQVVRDLAGGLLADDRVGHCFTMEGGLIRRMEVCAAPVVGKGGRSEEAIQ